MIKIVKLQEKKNQQVAVIVRHNAENTSHISTLHIIMKYHLEAGQTLTQDKYQRFIEDSSFELLYAKSISYISYQMRTISEMKKYLAKDTKNEKLIHQIIHMLKEHHYLSDSTYVKLYVEEKMEYDLVGPRYIKEKLIQKGIHFRLIDAELLHFSEDMEFDKVMVIIHKEMQYKQQKPYQKVLQSLKRKCIAKGFHLWIIESAILSLKEEIQSQIDEIALLRKEFVKIHQEFDLNNYEQRQKALQKLVRKGYSYDAVKRHMKQEVTNDS